MYILAGRQSVLDTPIAQEHKRRNDGNGIVDRYDYRDQLRLAELFRGRVGDDVVSKRIAQGHHHQAACISQGPLQPGNASRVRLVGNAREKAVYENAATREPDVRKYVKYKPEHHHPGANKVERGRKEDDGYRAGGEELLPAS